MIRASLVFLGLLIGTNAGAFDISPWILQSNLVALQFTRDLALRNPELGSALGYTDFDAQTIAIKDDIEADDEKFFSGWLKSVQSLLKVEKHSELRRDYRLLETVLSSQVESIRLDRKYRILPLYKTSRLVLSNLRTLESPDRLKDMVVRFQSYANGAPAQGSKPLAEAYESRLRFLIKKYTSAKERPFFPAKEELETYLKESPADMEAIQKLLAQAQPAGWQASFENFKAQVARYNAFVRAELLPRARPNARYPVEIYRWVLRSKSVGWDEKKLMSAGRKAFSETLLEWAKVSKLLAREMKLKDSAPISVLKVLRARQLTEPAQVELKYREAANRLDEMIAARDLVTMASAPLELRLGSAEDGQSEPYPHLTYPPLAMGVFEQPAVILPIAPGSKFPTDDFTHEAGVLALLAHEGRPGHEAYFEALLEKGVSLLRARYGYSIPSVEGWAFYAEELSYPDLPLSAQFVVLQMRLWSFARMFLDPEVHFGQTSREGALKILVDQIGLSAPVAEAEVQRFLSVDPGHSPGYGYGLLKFQELRFQVKARMGRKFSERCFNDAVIALGLLPVDWLEQELKTLKCPNPAPPFSEWAKSDIL